MRVSTLSTFQRVLSGLRTNQFKAASLQEQIASGRRILRPSDDPAGAGRALGLRRQLAEVGRHRDAISRGRDALDMAGSVLQQGSTLITDARELILQALNGTLSPEDRTAIAGQFDALHHQLLDVANADLGGRYLFGGTATGTPPFVQEQADGVNRVVYAGSDQQQLVRAAPRLDVAITTQGDRIFGPGQPLGTRYDGLTGIATGTTADKGAGSVSLELRHDATDLGAAVGAGIAAVNGGADDTLLGSNTLTVDATLGTIQLGDGPVLSMPDTASPEALDFVVSNELGGELHLDLSGYTGVDYSGDVSGQGSVSLDGQTFVPLTFTETDLELRDDSRGIVLHVDATGVARAGDELVTFEGTTSVFDLMQDIARDLRNADDLETSAVLNRLRQKLGDLDRAHEDLLVGISDLGLRSQRLFSTDQQRQDVELSLESLLSSVEDVDLSEAALELAQADLALQLAQASGARLMQSTLLNFL